MQCFISPPWSLPRLHPIYLCYTDECIHLTIVVLIVLQKLIYAKSKIGGKVPPEEYVEGLGPCQALGSDKKEVHIFSHQGLKSRNVVLDLMTTNTRSPRQVVQSPEPKNIGHWLLDNFWPIFGARQARNHEGAFGGSAPPNFFCAPKWFKLEKIINFANACLQPVWSLRQLATSPHVAVKGNLIVTK